MEYSHEGRACCPSAPLEFGHFSLPFWIVSDRSAGRFGGEATPTGGGESRRDSATKPRVARHALPWVHPPNPGSTATRLRPSSPRRIARPTRTGAWRKSARGLVLEARLPAVLLRAGDAILDGGPGLRHRLSGRRLAFTGRNPCGVSGLVCFYTQGSARTRNPGLCCEIPSGLFRQMSKLQRRAETARPNFTGR